jgi:hypothetical protein
LAKFLPHARLRMSQRQITEEEVDEVLREPDVSYPSTTPGRRVHVREIGGRSIAVVVFDADPDRVVTAFVQLAEQ